MTNTTDSVYTHWRMILAGLKRSWQCETLSLGGKRHQRWAEDSGGDVWSAQGLWKDLAEKDQWSETLSQDAERWDNADSLQL